MDKIVAGVACPVRMKSPANGRWLHQTLNDIAQARAERGDAEAFRLMQRQAMLVGQRRIEIGLRIAELEGPARRQA